MSTALTATKRDMKLDAKKLRAEGRTPAVLYAKGFENLHFSLDAKELEKAIANKEVQYELSIDGETYNAGLKDVSRDYLKDCIYHVDFLKQ